MNKWIKRVVTSALVIAQFLVIPAVSASSLESIQSERKTLESEVNQIQNQISEKLSEASELSVSLDQLNQEISEHEEEIIQTTDDIEEQEILVEKRYEHTAEQLKTMQKSEINHNVILSIFQAESMTEFFNALYTASVLTGASEDQLIETQEEQDKLNNLKEELLVQQEELDDKKTQTVEQKEDLDKKLADLKTTLATNQSELRELNTKEAELKAPKKEDTVVATSSNAKADTKSKSKSSKKSSSKPTSKSSSSSDSAGSWMTYESTGYSMNEPGLNHQTATGVDLRENTRVIAVDPSQIPLGSLVEIEGKGIYLAADTGGVINGRIIDIHFDSISEMNSWGRRNVRIRIVQ